MPYQSKIVPHWIPKHKSQEDEEYLRGAHFQYIKVMEEGSEKIPCLDLLMRVVEKSIVIRSWEITENKKWGNRGIKSQQHAIEMARAHAHQYAIMLANADLEYGPNVVDRSRIFVESLNEPRLYGDEPPEFVAAYNVEFATRNRDDSNVGSGLMNTGVGWPGNSDTTEVVNTKPIWGPYESVMEACLKTGSMWSAHEYWNMKGPVTNWGWWAGRFTACPWPEVPMYIGECGIDAAVDRGVDHFGWHGISPDLDSAADEYVYNHLGRYDQQLQYFPQVLFAAPFTEDYGNNEWMTFDTRPKQYRTRLVQHRAWMAAATKIEDPWALPVYSDAPMPPAIWGDANVTRWKPLAVEFGAIIGVDPKILGTIISVESNGDPNALGAKLKKAPNPESRAVGLMQVVPVESGYTWAIGRPTTAELLDPKTNVRWGSNILNDGLKRYGGSLSQALAAYYTGSGDVTSPAAVVYLSRFRAYWANLWTMPCPLDAAPAPTPEPPAPPVEEPEPPAPPLAQIKLALKSARNTVTRLEAMLPKAK